MLNLAIVIVSKILCTVTNDLVQDQRMIRICSSLQENGYEVVLVGRLRYNSLPLAPQSFAQHRIPCWFDTGKLFYLEYNIRLLWYMWRNPSEIINAVDLDTLLPAFVIQCYRKKTTVVYDAHEYFTEVPEVIRRPIVRKIWSLLADFIIPRLNHAYTVGPALAKVLSERYETSFHVVRNVPVASTVRSQEKDTAYRILYQGMLNEGRGLEVAIRAMKLLPSHFKLTLVGTGDLEDQLKRLAISEGVCKQVVFTGFVPPAELSKYTQQAWIGLNLLENKGLSYYYSLANKAFDYIQAHCPSIQMPFPEYQSIQEEFQCFLLLQNLNHSILAELISNLANDPIRYAKLVQQNSLAAQQLNWSNEEQNLLEIYREVSI